MIRLIRKNTPKHQQVDVHWCSLVFYIHVAFCIPDFVCHQQPAPRIVLCSWLGLSAACANGRLFRRSGKRKATSAGWDSHMAWALQLYDCFLPPYPYQVARPKTSGFLTLCHCGSCTVQLSSIQLDMMQSMNPCWSFPASTWGGTIHLHWGHCPSDFLGPFRGRLAKSVGSQVWDSSCKQRRGLGPSTAPTNRTTPGRQLINTDLYLSIYIYTILYSWFHLLAQYLYNTL